MGTPHGTRAWFITGVSRGLGHALAEAVLAEGDTVIGTVRRRPPALAASRGRLHLLEADLSDPLRTQAVVEEAFGWAGRIDVVVNNAGYGLLGSVEATVEEEMRQLFEVDVFAPILIVRTALPHLRAQGSGHIVNVTSIAGRAFGPGIALYAAAKHALEGFSASLAQEVAPLGLRVTAVAPGQFRTDFLDDSSARRSRQEDAAYAGTVGAAMTTLAQLNHRQLGDPMRAARAIIDAVRADEPPLHLLLGSDAVRRARIKMDAMSMEMTTWEACSFSTDFPA